MSDGVGYPEQIGQWISIERGLGPCGRLATVVFDRGDRLNALSSQAMRDLRAAAESFEHDSTTSVVVLTGNARGFSAGFDLADPNGAPPRDAGLSDRRALLRLGPAMCDAWERMEQVTIAAIEGHCIGGGVALVGALDFRTCAADAHFRVPEVALGMNMSWGSLPRLLHLLGPARAKQIVMLADERVDAQTALDWGLVEHVVPSGQAFASAVAFGERFAKQPPVPIRMTKQSLRALSTALDGLAAHMDLDQYALATQSEDFREGVAAFRERRPPNFTGR
jgi:enoyl-CoA hydratase